MSIQGNSYVRFLQHFTEEKVNSIQTEVIWFPYDSKYYDTKCDKFNSFLNETTSEKFFLIFSTSMIHLERSYEMCNIRFDSSIVVYYPHKTNKSSSNIQFKEIYKIKDKDNIQSNVLGNININSNEFDLSPLNKYIWRRRNNLHQALFTAVGEVGFPFVERVEYSKQTNGDIVYNPIGYYPDILNHLMKQLNFTMQSSLPQTRNNWKYLVSQIHKGHFDISIAYFTFNSHRNELVDFSFGITPLMKSLFYLKGSKIRIQ